MVKRVFELLEELKTLLKDNGKHDLLADFNEEGFPERLAYLADIFEALNDLKFWKFHLLLQSLSKRT